MNLPTSFPDNSSNSSDYKEPPIPGCDLSHLYPDWIYSVIPVYISVIAALGILFNLVVLLVFILHKKACNVAEIYLFNMAAADFLLVLFLPFWAVYVSGEFRWPFGANMCRFVPLCIVLNSNCSIYFLVLVCTDRYLALVHPLSQSKLRRRKFAKLNCLLVWIFGLILGIPTLICRQVIEHNVTTPYNVTFKSYKLQYSCILNCPHVNMYYTNEVIQTIVAFIIPLCIITFCTVKIVQALNNRPTEESSTQKTEYKATILILVVMLAFLICWLPFYVVKIIELLLRLNIIDTKYCHIIRHFNITKNLLTYFAYFNSDLNPVLYVMVGKNFRTKMWEVFSRYGSERKKSTQVTMTTSNCSSNKSKVNVTAVK